MTTSRRGRVISVYHRRSGRATSSSRGAHNRHRTPVARDGASPMRLRQPPLLRRTTSRALSPKRCPRPGSETKREEASSAAAASSSGGDPIRSRSAGRGTQLFPNGGQRAALFRDVPAGPGAHNRDEKEQKKKEEAVLAQPRTPRASQKQKGAFFDD